MAIFLWLGLIGDLFATSLLQKSGFLAQTRYWQSLSPFSRDVGAAVTGIVIERLAYRPLRKASRLAALISAIGASIILQESVRLVPTIGKKILEYQNWSRNFFFLEFSKGDSKYPRIHLAARLPKLIPPSLVLMDSPLPEFLFPIPGCSLLCFHWSSWSDYICSSTSPKSD